MTIDEVLALAPVWEKLIACRGETVDMDEKTRSVRGSTMVFLRFYRDRHPELAHGTRKHKDFIQMLEPVWRAVEATDYTENVLQSFFKAIGRRLNDGEDKPRQLNYPDALKLVEPALQAIGQGRSFVRTVYQSGFSVLKRMPAPPASIASLSDDHVSALRLGALDYMHTRTVDAVSTYLRVEPTVASKLVRVMSWPECDFLILVAKQYRHNPNEFWSKIANGDYSFEVDKRGDPFSHLYVTLNRSAPESPLFVRTMPNNSALFWEMAADRTLNIPVEPVFSIEDDRNKEGIARITTRYCGRSLREWIRTVQYLETKMQVPPEVYATLYKIFYIAVKEIEQLANVTKHGHPHPSNITVEFVRKTHYHKHGKDVNSREFYDPTQVHYDLFEYLRNPDAYEMVVRVIDFDRADEPLYAGDME